MKVREIQNFVCSDTRCGTISSETRITQGRSRRPFNLEPAKGMRDAKASLRPPNSPRRVARRVIAGPRLPKNHPPAASQFVSCFAYRRSLGGALPAGVPGLARASSRRDGRGQSSRCPTRLDTGRAHRRLPSSSCSMC